jgi:hypothetical protein
MLGRIAMTARIAQFVIAGLFTLSLASLARADSAAVCPPTCFLELYSNADGTLQFIAVVDNVAQLHFAPPNLAGQTLSVAGLTTTSAYTFPQDLPADVAGHRRFLMGTQGFADLNLVKPDFVVPNGFLPTDGLLIHLQIGDVDYVDVDYGALSIPTDGATALYVFVDENDVLQAVAVNSAGDSATVVESTPTTTVVEYQNTEDFPDSPGGHFFYTDNVEEQARVDSGSAGHFVRTGWTFKAGGPKALCRFYGSVVPGPNSHFYTISDQECDWLKGLQQVPTPTDVQQWNYEGLVFTETPPQIGDAGAACPAETIPVRRAYNNAYPIAGPKNPWDSAHRYSSDPTNIQLMVTQFGWIDEGIAFCAMP